MINQCPICDTKCNNRMSTIDYTTGMVFCDNHLAKCESIYRSKVFGNSNALSVWLRVIADARDTYQANQDDNKASDKAKAIQHGNESISILSDTKSILDTLLLR